MTEKTFVEQVDEKRLLGNADAKVWAEEFVKLCNKKPEIATDEGTMIGWFANAIMAGWDRGRDNFIDKQKVMDSIKLVYDSKPFKNATEFKKELEKELGL